MPLTTEETIVGKHVRQPPLGHHYPWVATVAILALAPYIVLTTATPLLQTAIVKGAHLSMVQEQLAEALSNAGYAFGAVLASWLVQRYQQRVLFTLTEVGFVIASVLAALSVDPALYLIGRIGQGATTGLMLVIALPPLLTRFGIERLPSSAVIVNIGLFGAVAAGPLVGSAAATGDHWRWVFAVAALLGAVGVVLGLAALERFEPFDTTRPPDSPAFALALVAAVLPFFGVAHLVTHRFVDPIVWVPVAVGLVALVTLLLVQRLRSNALMPVSPMLRPIPSAGLLVAMVSGAVTVAVIELLITFLSKARMVSPGSSAGWLWPLVPGVVIGAVTFGMLLRTRWVPVMIAFGLVAVIAAASLLRAEHSRPEVMAAVGLLGLGAGTTVSPGLFFAAWSVRSSLVGRVFALVELLRAEAAYLVGPILLHLAETDPTGGSKVSKLQHGFDRSVTITIIVAAAGLLVILVLWALSRASLRSPDLEGWLNDDREAVHA